MSERMHLPRARGPIVWALMATAVALFVVLGSVAAESPGQTKGRIPPEAFSPDGTLDMSLVPDFVSVLDRDGALAGYVASSDLGLRPSDEIHDVLTVYGEDLQTVVGSMIAGRGFVPVGDAPETVPTFEVHTMSQ
jgi:hypothetical protein